MLRFIAGQPDWLSRDEIATGSNVSPTSSGLGSGLRELVALQIVEVQDGRYRLSEDLR